jgi:hypothetical protein
VKSPEYRWKVGKGVGLVPYIKKQEYTHIDQLFNIFNIAETVLFASLEQFRRFEKPIIVKLQFSRQLLAPSNILRTIVLQSSNTASSKHPLFQATLVSWYASIDN